jgi:hypothetical protein
MSFPMLSEIIFAESLFRDLFLYICVSQMYTAGLGKKFAENIRRRSK